MIVSSPVLVFAALAIRIDSKGPVLFKQTRAGEFGKQFTIYKLRTMVDGADQMVAKVRPLSPLKGPAFKIPNDPRITRVGRYLRRWSLDELPQFWNVLKGDMSLVGPRPPLVIEYERFSEQQKKKLAVRPGMTSLWQVSGKPSDFDEWLRLDLEYIQHWSFWLDIKILLKTALVVLTGKNY